MEYASNKASKQKNCQPKYKTQQSDKIDSASYKLFFAIYMFQLGKKIKNALRDTKQ
jgi:hypothetical protein